MPLPSKEENVLDLFFNSQKHWHFEELLEKSDLSRGRLNSWLHKFLKEGIIIRVKKKWEMPYYQSNIGHPAYTNGKRLYALNTFYKTGFLNHLQSLPDAKTVIIFGSMVRSDWYKESDIDLFIYGDNETLQQGTYERKLKREIQVFSAKKRSDLRKYSSGLLTNIVKGYIVKGNLDFAEVNVRA